MLDSVQRPITAFEWVTEILKQRPLEKEEVDAFGQYFNCAAVLGFKEFRKLMRPRMIEGWWTDEIAATFQQFYDDLVAGKRPKLAIGAPPQHGKSWAATDFIAWVAGKNPDPSTIFASYSDDLGTRTNLDLQRAFTTPQFRSSFPDTRVGEHGWQFNTNLIEYAGRSGSFRNTTIGGAINGMELHLGVIDDPVKGRACSPRRPSRKKFLRRHAAGPD
jgi:hypothetical protein